MAAEQNESSSFLDLVDNDLRDGIQNLIQKLRGLYTEINLKLKELGNLDDEESVLKQQQLSLLLEEIEKALAGIEDLSNMVIPEGMTNEEFLAMNHEDLDAFRQMMTINTEEIEKLSEKI